VAKQVLQQEPEPRHDEELEGLKQGLRERAQAIADRERELEREHRKLTQRERRLGRRLRLLRAERSWFTPVKRTLAERTDDAARLERAAAALGKREEQLSAREAEAESLAGELETRKGDLDRSEAELAKTSSRLEARERDAEKHAADLESRGEKLSARERTEAEGRGRLERDREALAEREKEIDRLRAEVTAEGEAVAARAAELERRLDDVERREGLLSDLDARTEAAAAADEHRSAEEERLASFERELSARAQAVDAREIEVAALDERRRELEERERAFNSATEEAAERERLQQRLDKVRDIDPELGDAYLLGGLVALLFDEVGSERDEAYEALRQARERGVSVPEVLGFVEGTTDDAPQPSGPFPPLPEDDPDRPVDRPAPLTVAELESRGRLALRRATGLRKRLTGDGLAVPGREVDELVEELRRALRWLRDGATDVARVERLLAVRTGEFQLPDEGGERG